MGSSGFRVLLGLKSLAPGPVWLCGSGSETCRRGWGHEDSACSNGSLGALHRLLHSLRLGRKPASSNGLASVFPGTEKAGRAIGSALGTQGPRRPFGMNARKSQPPSPFLTAKGMGCVCERACVRE